MVSIPLFHSRRASLRFLIPVFVLLLAGSAAAEEYYLHPFDRQQLSSTFYGEGANMADVNNDGTPDVISGPYWYEGPDFEKKHAYYKPKAFDPETYSNNFFVFVHDLNGDDRTDLLVIGFPGKTARWYENPGPDQLNEHWPEHVVFDGVDNESPTFTDLTGDGKPELVCQHNNRFGFVEVNWVNPRKQWKFRPISGKGAGGRFSHGLGVGDVNGDGRPDLLEKNGWWEQPSSLKGNPKWTHHEFTFSKAGGAQMYAYDVDEDGNNDVITSLDAHGWGLAWYEQIKKDGSITFKQHRIMGEEDHTNKYGVTFSQLHAIDLADIDGDGIKDIITGKRWMAHKGKDPGSDEPAVLYWFRLKRTEDGVEFVPHPIDNDSGVGTQVVAGQLNNDDHTDIVVGNKKGTFAFIQKPKKVSKGRWTWAHQPGKLSVGRPPEKTVGSFQLPGKFQANVAAAEPRVTQPIALAYDHQGRLWIAEHVEYPEWSEEGDDRILIFDDTNNDGTLDKRTVFYEGLNFVSGLEVGFGGVWVGSAPDLLFIPDRNGDDEPDSEPRVKLTGWAHQDTHETLNGFIWGPDGWLYGCHGVFNHSRVGKPGIPKEDREPINAGYWRYHPIKEEFEVFAWGTSNPWGIDFNDYGEAISPVCVIPHLHHVVQGARLKRQAGDHFNKHVYKSITSIGDHVHYAGSELRTISKETNEAGGGHAHAGAMVYLGGKWPEKYRNTLFMSNIRGNRINNDDFEKNGSSFTGTHNPDFLVSGDQWFRGLNLRYGPDGDVFLIDWYDQEACHQVRPDDARNGRIYKISYGEPDPVDVNLNERSDKELVQMQLEENDWYVRHARRILQHRAARGQLKDGTRKALWNLFEQNDEVPRKLRALWTLHVTGGIDSDRTKRLLTSEHEYVRAWAVRFALEDRDVSNTVHEELVRRSQTDSSPVVRRFLASALQRMSHSKRWPIVRGLLSHEKDRTDHVLPKLTWYGFEPLVASEPDRALNMIRDTNRSRIWQFTVRRVADAGALDTLTSFLNELQSSSKLQMSLSQVQVALKDQTEISKPKGWDQLFERVMNQENKQARKTARQLAVTFGDQSAFPSLRKTLRDESKPVERRKFALKTLLRGEDPELPTILHELLEQPAFRTRALKALASYRHPDTPEAILKHYGAYSSEQKKATLSTLSSRSEYALALLDAIEDGTVPRSDLTPTLARQIKNLDDGTVQKRLEEVWGTIRSSSEAVRKRIAKYKKQFTPETLEKADRSRGRKIYERTCANCHKLFGEGGELGPELTGANRQSLDYLLQNIVDPNAVVGKEYRMTLVKTTDGRVITGILKSTSEDTVTIQTIDKEVVVSREKIKEKTRRDTSMMPPGQLRALSEKEVRDLIGYLQSEEQVPLPDESR